MKEFEDYIYNIVNQTRLNDVEKGELFLELYDHLESLRKEYIQQGKGTEEAIHLAIQTFGSSELLGKEIQKSMFPYERFVKWTSWTLFIPYILFLTMVWFYPLDQSRDLAAINHFRETQDIKTLFFNLVHFIPFQYEFNLMSNIYLYTPVIFIKHIIITIIFFVPFGLLTPILFTKLHNFKTALKLFICTTFMIEFVKLVTLLGVFETTNILLGTVGASIGYGLWILVRKIPFVSKILHREKTVM